MRLKNTGAGRVGSAGIVDRRFAGVDPAVGNPAPVEFGEKRPEPVGMLVVDGEGRCHGGVKTIRACHARQPS